MALSDIECQRRVALIAANNPVVSHSANKPFHILHNSINKTADLAESIDMSISDITNINTKLDDYTTFVVHGTWSETQNTKPEKQVQKYVSDYSREYGKELIVLETNLLSRVTTPTGILGKYHRIGLGHWLYNRGKFIKSSDDSRFNKFISDNNIEPFDWKRDGDYVLIILGFSKDPSNDVSPLEYMDTVIPDLLQTYAKIKVRPHPLTKSNATEMELIINKINYYGVELDDELNFVKSISNTLFCVMYNSTSIFECIWYGVPCFTNINNFGYSLSIADLTSFGDYSYPDRTPWFVEMSWCEYTRSEMAADTFWNFLVENLLNENSNNN